MSNQIEKFIQFLSEPGITAQFQCICGIKEINASEHSESRNDDTVNLSNKSRSTSVSNGVDVAANFVNGSSNSCLGTKRKTGNSATSRSTGANNFDDKVSNLTSSTTSETFRGMETEKVHPSHPGMNGMVSSNKISSRSISNKFCLKNGSEKDMVNQFASGINNIQDNLSNDYKYYKKMNVYSPDGPIGNHNNGRIKESSMYIIKYPFLYYLFSFGASLGNETFYVLFFSFTLWNFDNYVIRRVLIVWAVIMYAGQAAKDIIRWPRPKSPPVIRLEDRYELEFGMPSTHAMVGVAIPFSMLIFMSGRYEFYYLIGVLVSVLWCVLVSISRLYLGMHSVLDVIAGLLFAFLLMLLTVPFVEIVDKFILTYSFSLPIVVLICIVLCLLYPSQERWNTARGDTVLVLGVFSGIYAGLWLTVHLTEFTELPHFSPYAQSLLGQIVLVAIRQLVGVIIIILFLTIIKLFLLNSLSWYFGFDPKNPVTKHYFAIELPYKYISYFISGAAASYLVPLIYLKLNIARLNYYSEIFH